MPLLVSDANIFIDMEAGELLEAFFALPFEIYTPDVLYADELEEHHSNLLDLGLVLGELDGDEIGQVEILIDRYPNPGRIDWFAMLLAQKLECRLLSGDRMLVQAARAEGLEVNGSIWILEQLVLHRVVPKKQALNALGLMRDAGRRLPWDTAVRTLRRV